MIRLTVLYNLPEGTDEEEFLAWRLGEHQASNAGMPGVQYTDFARVVESWPPGTSPPHRFMTTADWPDWESFRAAFYDPQAQKKLTEDVKRINEFVFYVSEDLISEGSIG
jgi:EthD domain